MVIKSLKSFNYVFVFNMYMTKHTIRKIVNFRHLLCFDTIGSANILAKLTGLEPQKIVRSFLFVCLLALVISAHYQD